MWCWVLINVQIKTDEIKSSCAMTSVIRPLPASEMQSQTQVSVVKLIIMVAIKGKYVSVVVVVQGCTKNRRKTMVVLLFILRHKGVINVKI